MGSFQATLGDKIGNLAIGNFAIGNFAKKDTISAAQGWQGWIFLNILSRTRRMDQDGPGWTRGGVTLFLESRLPPSRFRSHQVCLQPSAPLALFRISLSRASTTLPLRWNDAF